MRSWALLLLVPGVAACAGPTPIAARLGAPPAVSPASPYAGAELPPTAVIVRSAAAPARNGDPADTRAYYNALPLLDTFDAWKPSGDALFAALFVGTEAGDDLLAALTPAERVNVLRAGLRLAPGRAAWECARRLDWRHMDVQEQRVAVEHVVNAVLDPTIETPGGAFWDLLECFGAADVPWLLEQFRDADPDVLDRATVSLVHKVTHAEHFPLLEPFYDASGATDPPEMIELLSLAVSFTDQHRDVVARSWWGREAIDQRSPKTEGLPAALTVCLESLLRDDGAPYRERYSSTWRARWLRDAVPANVDATLLLRLEDRGWSRPLVLWSMRHLSDAATLERLRKRADLREFDPDDDHVAARGALAFRGDAAALDSLEMLCTTDGLALALLLEIRPELAVEAVTNVLLDSHANIASDDGEESALDACLAALWEAHGDARLDFGATWNSSVFASLEERVLTADIEASRVLHIAHAIPALWTRRMAERAVARMGAAPPDDEIKDGDWYGGEHYALAEVGAPDAFRTRLRRWAQDERPGVRAMAVWSLLKVGDPRSGKLLIEALRAIGDELWGGELWIGELGLEYLALSPGPEVEAYLRELVTPDTPERVSFDRRFGAAVGLAMLHGLPTSLLQEGEWWAYAEWWDDGDARSAEIDTFCALALQGRGVDAYVSLLDAHPDTRFPGAGDIHDPRVTVYLERLRRERHLESYAFATAELAIQGDLGARAEQWAALKRGLYRWCDDTDARTATIGFDLGLVPQWAEFIEAGDCQEPTARVPLRDLFGVDLDNHSGWGHTGAHAFSVWRADRPGPFVRSRLTDKFVPVPR